MNFSLGVTGFCPSYYQKVKAAFKQVAVFFQICKCNFGIYTALYVIQKHVHTFCVYLYGVHTQILMHMLIWKKIQAYEWNKNAQLNLQQKYYKYLLIYLKGTGRNFGRNETCWFGTLK